MAAENPFTVVDGNSYCPEKSCQGHRPRECGQCSRIKPGVEFRRYDTADSLQTASVADAQGIVLPAPPVPPPFPAPAPAFSASFSPLC